MQLSSLLDYIKELEAWRLDGYDGDDVEHILHLLQQSPPDARSLGTPNSTVLGDQGPRSKNVTLVVAASAREGDDGTATHGVATHGTANDLSTNAELAHALHFASIGLLGLLVIEVLYYN